MQPDNIAAVPVSRESVPVSRESSLMAEAEVGMKVIDLVGQQAGVVTAVQLPGTGVRPDTVAGIAETLMDAGYLRVDGTGFLSNDTYASGDQVADVVTGEPGVVSLRVHRDELHRSTA